MFFFSVVEDLIANDALVLADLRVTSLVQLDRTPHLNKVMLFLTYLGNWQIVAAGASLLALYLALTRQWIWVPALFISIGGGEILVWIGKAGFARPRPDLINALIPAQGLSFPRGHAFVAISFYGSAAWFAIDRTKNWTAKAAIAAAVVITILAIAFSRIYLGVHWPSDVLASFALGAAWLAAIITFFTVVGVPAPGATSRRARSLFGMLASVFFVAWVSFIGFFYYTHPLVNRIPQDKAPAELPASNFPDVMFAKAPRFSEDIIGKPIEPINVIVVGSEAEVSRAFAEAGWEPTDKLPLKAVGACLSRSCATYVLPVHRGFQHSGRASPINRVFSGWTLAARH